MKFKNTLKIVFIISSAINIYCSDNLNNKGEIATFISNDYNKDVTATKLTPIKQTLKESVHA